jgi:hypothetical protein
MLKNEKIDKFKLNQENGLVDMNRDINIKLIEFIEFEKDIINVWLIFYII